MNPITTIRQENDHLWDKLFLLCELDEEYRVTAINNSLMSITDEQVIGQFIERYAVPFSLDHEQVMTWNEVWHSLSASEIWKGYIVASLNRRTRQILYTRILKKEHTQGYICIAENMDHYVADYIKKNDQLHELTKLKEAFDEASIIAITDPKGIITYANDKFCEISKYERTELVGRTHRVINSQYHPKSFFKDMWDTISKGKVWRGEVRNRAKDGSYYWMKTTIVPFLDNDNKPYQYVSIRSDITDRIAAETELAQVMEYDFRRTVRGLQNAIFKVERNKDAQIIFTLSEGKIAEELQMTTDQVKGKTLGDVFGEHYQDINSYFERSFEGHSDQFEIYYQQRYFYILLSPMLHHEHITEVVASMIDITERKKAEEIIHYMAHYDSLTIYLIGFILLVS